QTGRSPCQPTLVRWIRIHSGRWSRPRAQYAIQLTFQVVLAPLIALWDPAGLGIACRSCLGIVQRREPRAELPECGHGCTPGATAPDALEPDAPDPGVAPPVHRGRGDRTVSSAPWEAPRKLAQRDQLLGADVDNADRDREDPNQ